MLLFRWREIEKKKKKRKQCFYKCVGLTLALLFCPIWIMCPNFIYIFLLSSIDRFAKFNTLFFHALGTGSRGKSGRRKKQKCFRKPSRMHCKIMKMHDTLNRNYDGHQKQKKNVLKIFLTSSLARAHKPVTLFPFSPISFRASIRFFFFTSPIGRTRTRNSTFLTK